MKLSSRKQLLDESDILLKEIRTNIRRESLNEDINMKEFFNNLVKSIVSVIVMGYKKGRQSVYYRQLPYLVGLDLVNNQNLKIDRSSLTALNTVIKDIINDIKTSPQLKSAMGKLEDADFKVGAALDWIAQRRGRKPYVSPHGPNIDAYPIIERPYHAALEKYNRILREEVAGVVADILRGDKYKNFAEMIMQTLQKGIQGLSEKEMEQVQQNYMNMLIQRVAEYVDRKEVKHYVGYYTQIYSDPVLRQ